MDTFVFSDYFHELIKEDHSDSDEWSSLNKGKELDEGCIYKYDGMLYKYIGFDVVFGLDEDVLIFECQNNSNRMFTRKFFEKNFSEIDPKEYLK